MKTSRIRILLVTACALLFGSALAATAMPAHAAVNTITFTTAPPTTETSPLGTAVDIPVTATDSDATQTLTYTLAEVPPLPAGDNLAVTPATAASGAAVAITGTFAAAYTGTVTVTATDTTLVAATAPITWTAANTVTVTPPGTQAGKVGIAAKLQMAATDSEATVTTFAWSDTGLPPGLAIAPATGLISGTPTTPGSYPVTVTATDASGATDTVDFTWTIDNLITVTAPATEKSTVGVAITPVQVTATDSAPAEKLTFSAAGLPPGLKINAATGVITGTPTGTTAAYTATITAADPTGAAGDAVITWAIGVVNRVTVTAPVKEQTWLGIPVSVKITAKDSDPTQTLTFTAAGLPAGLSINAATGVVSGTPQKITAGAVTVTVTVTDGAGFAGKAAAKWSVGYPVVIPNPGKVTAVIGQAVNVAFTDTDIANKKAHVTLSATGLPRGLTFRPSTPLIYGWPTATGTYHVTIHAKDSLGGISLMTFPLVVRFAANGPVGQIRLALNGKCLTDPGNKTANGIRVNVSNCSANAAQRWTVGSDGTIRVHGRCLDIAGQGSAAGQPAQLWRCNGSTREIWVQGTAAELVNPASGLCLTDPRGTVPTMGTCRIKKSEAWTLPAQPVLAAVTGKCVDDLHDVGTNGAVVDMYSCNGTPPQAWTFAPDGTIHSAAYGNKCVTVRTLGRVGTKVVLWACSASNRGQHWAVVRNGDLSSELSIGGVCLAIPSLTAADGSQLVMARCTLTDPRIHWRVW